MVMTIPETIAQRQAVATLPGEEEKSQKRGNYPAKSRHSFFLNTKIIPKCG
jgi:hypothetical protein